MTQTRYTVLRRHPLTMKTVDTSLVWIPRFSSDAQYLPRPVALHHDGAIFVSDACDQVRRFQSQDLLDMRLVFHEASSEPVPGPAQDLSGPLAAAGLILRDVHLHDGRHFDSLVSLADASLVGLDAQDHQPQWVQSHQISQFRRPGSVMGLSTICRDGGRWRARITGSTPGMGRWSR